MLGGTLALLNRSIRLDGRSPKRHLMRFGVALLVFIALIVSHVQSLSFGAPGLRFFRLISTLNFALITLAGMSLFASAVTEEKEEGTLGLLMMAGIGPLGILFGKSTSRVITVFLLLVVQLPFTILAVQLGGVTLRQIFAMFVALACYLFFAANQALLWSVLCRRSSSAGIWSGVVLITLLLLPTGLQWWSVSVPFSRIPWGADLAPQIEKLASALDRVSIYSRQEEICLTAFNESVWSRQTAVHLTAGVLVFIIAWLAFDRRTRMATPGPRHRVALFQAGGHLSRMGVGRAWTNPWIWKEFHFLAGGLLGFLLNAMICAACWGFHAAYLAWVSDRFPWESFWEGCLLSSAGIMITLLCTYAARIFHDEQRWGTLAVALLAPVSSKRFAYSKMLGCLGGLAAPLIAFVIAGFRAPHILNLYMSDVRFWHGAIVLAVFLHMTALLSLYVKWGALPLAAAILIVFGTLCGVPMMSLSMQIVIAMTGSRGATFMPALYFGLLIMAFLQIAIGFRLKRAARL